MKKENLLRIAVASLLAAGSGSAVWAIGRDAGTSGQMQSATPGPAHKQAVRVNMGVHWLDGTHEPDRHKQRRWQNNHL